VSRTHIQFGAAVLAAPLFVLLHNFLFQQKFFDLQLLHVDTTVLFFLILFYPVVEELAFRGMIQEYIASKTERYPVFFKLSVANILTSVLFVAMHFIHHTPLWALLVFVPSLVFGYFKEQYGHIGASIFLHMFYNACSLFLLF